MTEASKLYNVPHSTVFGWKRRLVGAGAEDEREEVLLFAKTHTPAEVKRKYNVDQATLAKWRRENDLKDAAAKSVEVASGIVGEARGGVEGAGTFGLNAWEEGWDGVLVGRKRRGR